MAPFLQFLLAVTLLAALTVGVVTALEELKGRRLQGRMQAHLGLSAGEMAFFLPHVLFPAYILDYARALATVVERRGMARETVGVHPIQAAGMGPPHPPALAALYEGTARAREGMPARQSFELSPEESESHPINALELLTGGDFPLIARLRISPAEWDPPHLDVGSAHTAEAMAYAQAFVQEVEDEARAQSIFRGRMVRPHIGAPGCAARIEILETTGEDDPCLPASLTRELDRAYLNFKRGAAALEARGVPTQRGLLLCGPPGTGKTSTCRYLHRQLPEHTFLAVPIASLDSLEVVFKIARRFAPSVVILDDVDLYANDRAGNTFVGLLGKLMAEMDGIASRDEIDVVMTSNTWASIEKALALRPGRIDAVLMYENPDAARRRAMLERFLDGIELEASLDHAAHLCEGFSPAQIRELTKRAVAGAAARGAGGPIPPVRRDDLEVAARGLRENPLMDRARTSRALGRRSDTLFRLESVRSTDPADTTESPEGA